MVEVAGDSDGKSISPTHHQFSTGIAMKKLKNELRISKKAEQLAKDKLATVKKQLEKAQ